jgi:hypothetical protein
VKITWTPTLTDRIALSDESLRVGVQVVASGSRFEGVSRLDPGEQQLIKELIESIMLKHDAKRYFKQEATR